MKKLIILIFLPYILFSQVDNIKSNYLNNNSNGDYYGCQDLDETLNRTLDTLKQANCRVTSIDSREANLEQLFLQLTGHSLRD